MKTLASESIFNKNVGCWIASLLQKRLQHPRFLVNSVKFLRTSFCYDTCERLFLQIPITLSTSKSNSKHN